MLSWKANINFKYTFSIICIWYELDITADV